MAKRGYTPKKPAKAPLRPLPMLVVPSLQLVKASLKLAWRNFEVISVTLVMPTLLLELSRQLTGDKFEFTNRMALAGLIGIISILWLMAGAGAVVIMQLQAVSGQFVRIRDCYRYGIRFLPRLIGLSLMVSLTALVSAVLLVVPGIIMLRRYLLAPLFLVDEDIGIRQAMQRSAAVTKLDSRAVYGAMTVMAILGLAAVAATKYLSVYGGVAATSLMYAYVFIPAIRYRELALGKTTHSLLNEPAPTSAVKK